MRPSRVTRLKLAVVLLGCLGSSGLLHARAPRERGSALFELDAQTKRITGPASRVSGMLKLDLSSVSLDQPQYWPNEAVHLKVVAPGRPGQAFTTQVARRDASPVAGTGTLDGQGVAVIALLDGGKRKLEPGEYRVDVRLKDGPTLGHATFGVVEGTLGAVSFAHDFKRVTSPDALETSKGAWFMGNAAGAGKRWGNGLSFKNELRVANQPYQGQVEVISRCMLPGCNGIHAGPSRKMAAENGQLAGTLEVGGHSGPFQIEVVTPKGSVRHQFEGSSHVEREMLRASSGVSYQHEVSLAPYENTAPVPGRQLYVQSRRGGAKDPFEIESIVAQGGRIKLRATRAMSAPAIFVHCPKKDGSFAATRLTLAGELRAGQEISVPVAMPYSLVTVGGFVDGQLREGWAMAFPPTALELAIEAPPMAGPTQSVELILFARDGRGQGVAASGILEVFDTRVASRSATQGLGSAIGDSVRAVSRASSEWVDRTGLDPDDESDVREERQRGPPRKSAPRPQMMAPSMKSEPSSPPPMSSMGAGAARGLSGQAASGRPQEDPDEAPAELIREGEKKVVFCGLVQTDASGRATVRVTLPPQIGRVSARLVAISGFDHAEKQVGIDVARGASVEPRLPRAFVPGSRLQIPVSVTNALDEPVTLVATGPGLEGRVTRTVEKGTRELSLPWRPTSGGKLVFELRTAKGKVLDRRELAVEGLGDQEVTFSRLALGGTTPIKVEAGDSVVVFPGPGALLGGMVMNMVTTMESWFGHAEAISAQAAVRATLLAAISRKLLDDEGLEHTLRTSLEANLRHLEDSFLDERSWLVRPYPGLAPNALWSAWTSRNLHAARRALEQDPALSTSMGQTLARLRNLTGRIDGALQKQNFALEEQGYDAEGRAVIPVELEGKVVYRVLTDDAVSRWAKDKLLPKLDYQQADAELAFSRLYDEYRFLRAFQRAGALQYLTEVATSLYLNGERQQFEALFAFVSRGMILSQEPGMVQGPALLGGVYSTPMAMVRFLDLLLLMSRDAPAQGEVVLRGAGGVQKLSMGQAAAVWGAGSLQVPKGAVARIDRKGKVPLLVTRDGPRLGTAALSSNRLAMAQEAVLTITLDSQRDPLEYYAIIAVPSTTSVKQTEDILSDYKGQLIYGQQATGGTKMQLLVVPFRGSRTMKLLLEGAFEGAGPGVVAIRHVENPGVHGAFAVPEVTVRGQ